MSHARIRPSRVLLATGFAAALAVAQVGMATASSAAPDDNTSPQSMSAQSTASPNATASPQAIKYEVLFPKTFHYYEKSHKVTGKGLTFGVKNNQYDGTFKNVTMTLDVTQNLTFDSGATTTDGGKISSSSSHKITVTWPTIGKGGSATVTVPATLPSIKNVTKVKVTVSSKTPAFKDSGTWHTKATATKPTSSPTAKPTHSSAPTTAAPSPSTSSSAAAPAPATSSPAAALPDTGSSSSTPAIAGGAGAVVVIGAGLAFYGARRRKAGHQA